MPSALGHQRSGATDVHQASHGLRRRPPLLAGDRSGQQELSIPGAGAPARDRLWGGAGNRPSHQTRVRQRGPHRPSARHRSQHRFRGGEGLQAGVGVTDEELDGDRGYNPDGRWRRRGLGADQARQDLAAAAGRHQGGAAVKGAPGRRPAARGAGTTAEATEAASEDCPAPCPLQRCGLVRF